VCTVRRVKDYPPRWQESSRRRRIVHNIRSKRRRDGSVQHGATAVTSESRLALCFIREKHLTPVYWILNNCEWVSEQLLNGTSAHIRLLNWPAYWILNHCDDRIQHYWYSGKETPRRQCATRCHCGDVRVNQDYPRWSKRMPECTFAAEGSNVALWSSVTGADLKVAWKCV